MQWSAVLGAIDLAEGTDTAIDVGGVQYDSRSVRQGEVFVAMQGGVADGNRYIEQALARGAVAVITDSAESYAALGREHPDVGRALVSQGRRALAEASAIVFGHPERLLALSAVTGTNGKTTTAFVLEQMLEGAGRRSVLVGTVETHVGGEVRPSRHTTPESRDLLEIFAHGVQAGCTEAVIEASSHALEQQRLWGIPVDVAIWTNLTQDHLDYHGTMDAYFAAKARLFEGSGTMPPRVAVVNADDPWSQRLLERELRSEVLRYGIDSGEFRAERIALRAGASSFWFRTPRGDMEMESPLTGRVNVYNVMAAACAAIERGLSLEQIGQAVRTLRQVPGRFETVPGSSGADFTVVVDYAHTEDALRNLIRLARELVAERRGRVITVFGCGGDRDRSKRPSMGRAAGEGSDLLVVTSDNPRTEVPGAIIAEILPGIEETGCAFAVEEDRTAAIRFAIGSAQPGDIVLIAGKGHEKVQIIGDALHPFDDVAVAAEILGA